MRYLLDTHSLLWWLFDDPKLSRRVRAVISEPENDILVSAASAWEISTRHGLGKLPEADDVASSCRCISVKHVLANSISRWNARWQRVDCPGRIEIHLIGC